MRDVSASMREMLRVLKPGGWLITTGDPFRSRTSNISKEFEVFNRHPDVLLGVNESIPSFTAFETVLLHYRPLLEIRLVTSGVLYGARFGKLKLKTDIAGLREWDFDKDRQMLGDTSGGLGICCRLRKLTGDASPRQAQAAIGAGAFAAVLSDYSAAIRRLAPLIPAEEVDRGFPGTEQSKVELLNGWQAPDGSDVRNAFRRARWFLRRPKSNDPLSFQVRYEHAANRSSSLNVLIDGQLLMRHELTSEWKDVSVSIGSVAPGDIFVCELQLDLEPTPDSPSFDDELFQVRRRQIAGTIGAVNVRKSWLARSLTKLLDGRNGRHR
jgi:hypothetical protein